MLSAGTQLGPYEVLGLLATGGMGEVYRARDPRLRREVAIKVLPEGVNDNPDRLRRFEQEACAAGALNHPNILAIHDVGVRDGAPYVVSELLEGVTLKDLVRSRGALPLRDVIGYATQIASGLAAAHEKGIVHRDLKPENLLVTKDRRVKIITRRCLEKDPAARFQSAQDIGFALEAVQDAVPSKPEAATPRRPGRLVSLVASARARRARAAARG
jgi:eukaryotic-like serine/threonine-protein kinase